MTNEPFEHQLQPVTQKLCEHCGTEYFPRQALTRFCCRDCKEAWFAKEKREALELLRQQRGGSAVND